MNQVLAYYELPNESSLSKMNGKAFSLKSDIFGEPPL